MLKFKKVDLMTCQCHFPCWNSRKCFFGHITKRSDTSACLEVKMVVGLKLQKTW